jgi:hypothetical protein
MKKIVFIAVVVLLATSCGKYDEGPGISLKSKTKRLAREWTVEKVVENGEDITSDYMTMRPTHTMLFLDYGSLKETVNQTVLAKGWEWGDKKETLVITYKLLDIEKTSIFTIRRLTSKEFWYNTTDDGKDYEFKWKAT